MGFVHNDEVRAGAQKVMASAIGLNEIHGDDHKRIRVENGLIGTQILFKTAGGARKHQFNGNVEFSMN